MIDSASTNRSALAELQLVEGDTENQTVRKGTSIAMLAHTQDSRPARLHARHVAWWALAVLAALAVVIAANPLVTDAILWTGFALATRLAVVDRRRARRAAHRAAVWHATATLEAVEVANTSREVAA